MTEAAQYLFTIRNDNGPWIYLECVSDNLQVLGDGFLGLVLEEGVTWEQARELADLLNERVKSVTYTK